MAVVSTSRWGTHAEFAQLFEIYIDAVYDSLSSAQPAGGRWRLIRSIGAELRSRGVRSVLDCAAGTGFPALDLATAPSLLGLTVHCTDADMEMLNVLGTRAKSLKFDPGRLAPPVGRDLGAEALGTLRIDWSELGKVRRTYDYVMCRGNSLTYADTWGGGRTIATVGLIREYLVSIAAKVDRGGYLHVDAPWRLGLPQEEYEPVAGSADSIWEQVTTESDCRHWRVGFKTPRQQTVKFERFSTRLTIFDIKAILDELRFDETEPFHLTGERPGFGVIIARKSR